jgi:hypothetical protein
MPCLRCCGLPVRRRPGLQAALCSDGSDGTAKQVGCVGCSSSSRKASGLTPTAVFALATPKRPIDRGVLRSYSNTQWVVLHTQGYTVRLPGAALVCREPNRPEEKIYC